MNLCQLTTVKNRLGIASTDLKDDTLLGNFIEMAGGRFEKFCSRRFERSASATYEFSADDTEVRVDRYPIESITSFHVKDGETTGWVLQSPGSDFAMVRRGCVISLSYRLGTWRQQARVTYAGGYVLPGSTPGTGQSALPDEIKHACVEQVAYWYQNRTRLGLTSVSGEGGSVSQFSSLDLLPTVEEILKPHRRINA